ncbi:hypothetical protein Mucpa_4991 [Mucilaginibacter paludis DSM 18603]|uniref:Uncharacterized protein n=2 Tax=Mucilaginibacter TaxID=423349 RepID=H1Y932_9SPHI|nr:hypothetical protein Mucpa_4991 [Mucilaginibacter paludis DSM 18603]
MAKDIKAIVCPSCGSVYKQELKPDFYKCQNCGTEYYLDNDDKHIYHHHETLRPLPGSTPPNNTMMPVYILIGAVLVIIVAYFTVAIWQSKSTNTNINTLRVYKAPRMFYNSFVYTNTLTGDPVYLRLGSDYISHGNDKSEQEYHAQFNNVGNGHLIADRIIGDDGLNNKHCLLTFKTYSPDVIYAIGCNAQLIQLDTRDNRLTDVTKLAFKDYPPLNSGVARLEFDYNSDMIIVMNNEGNSYYYFPTLGKLVDSHAQADSVWKKQFDRHFFEFASLGDDINNNNAIQLLETKYDKNTGQKMQRNLTPNRKYFNPKIIYQDKNNLLITAGTTAAADPPVTVQSIDVETGKIKWALPPDRYNLSACAKCKQGFALEYRKSAEDDYVHGVLVISGEGKLLYNYKLARTE